MFICENKFVILYSVCIWWIWTHDVCQNHLPFNKKSPFFVVYFAGIPCSLIAIFCNMWPQTGVIKSEEEPDPTAPNLQVASIKCYSQK